MTTPPYYVIGFNSNQGVTIRNSIMSRLSSMTVNSVSLASTRVVPILTMQPDQLPALSVFIIKEDAAMDGNTSIPQFKVSLELMLALTVMSSDPVFIDGSLDQFAAAVYNILLTDPTFLAQFEYVEKITREFAFKKEGESYIAEIGIRLTVSYRSRYEPLAPNSLTLIDIQSTEFPVGTPLAEVQISFA